MNINKRTYVYALVFLVVIALVVKAAAPASVRVGGSSLRANGELAQGFQYSGPCPVDLKFGWGLIATGWTNVTYTFVRSDGGRSTRWSTVNIPSANRSIPVYYDWHLGADNAEFANFRGWVEINIESPNRVSQRIHFTLHCGSGGM
jgi:hypothetical protein